MKVLVLGPGMIGTLVAAKLSRAGHVVTVLGRGGRLDAIERSGLRIRSARSETVELTEVATTDRLGDEAYDWILVTVRGDQVPSLLAPLAAHTATPNVMMMTNHAGDVQDWVDAIGADRIALGFPGLGAYFDDDGVLEYQVAPRAFQPTTLGELDGASSARLAALVDVFEGAGIPATIEPDIQAWLRYHVAWISVLGLMAAAADRSVERLASDASIRRRGVDAIREGFAVLDALGYRMTPGGLRVFTWTPRWLLAGLVKQMLKDPTARRAIEEPTDGMERESRHMVEQMIALSEVAGREMPAYRALAEALDPRP